MLSLREQVFHQCILLLFELFHLLILKLCEFAQSLFSICKSGFGFLRVLSALAAVCLIDNNGISAAALTADLIVDIWETMQCAYYNTGIAVADNVAEFEDGSPSFITSTCPRRWSIRAPCSATAG